MGKEFIYRLRIINRIEKSVPRKISIGGSVLTALAIVGGMAGIGCGGSSDSSLSDTGQRTETSDILPSQASIIESPTPTP